MIKKILIKLKQIFCFILIFSLSCVSFAAPGSGGAVFVTKEEVDKAFDDFSSRLTKFESGINSKIDSQVSSYLTRNSIWKGVPVVWDETSKEITYDSLGGAIVGLENSIKKVCRFTGTAKKKGLLFVTYANTATGDLVGAAGWRPYVRMSGGQWTGFESNMYLNLVGGQYDGATEVYKYSNLIMVSIQANGNNSVQNGSEMLLHLPPAGKWVMTFFVDKGPVWVGLDVFRIETNNNTKAISGLGFNANGAKMIDSIINSNIY